MFGLNGAVDQLTMANSVCWHCHVLRRSSGKLLRKASHFEVESEMEDGQPQSGMKAECRGRNAGGLSSQDALADYSLLTFYTNKIRYTVQIRQ